jgi:serine phosphatase RsbU (regulator of sigma subunit)
MQAIAPLHPQLADRVAQVLADGVEHTGVVLPGDRPGRWLDFSLSRVSEGVLVHAVDVSDLAAAIEREREARREAQLASARTARLQRVADALSTAVGSTEVMELIVAQAQDALTADAGIVALPDGDDVVAGRWSGYSAESMARWQRYPLAAPLPVSDALRSGELVFVSTQEEWDARYPTIAAEVVMPGLAVVPFVFEDEVLGAMALSFRAPRHFTAEERTFLAAMGRQCAQALERGRLYEERAYVARTLQEGLLPHALIAPPGLQTAVRYASIADGGEVGGDFYDLFETATGRYLAVVGDVCGKGTQAAVLTGLARHTVRAIALREERPEAVLAFLNDALRRHEVGGAFITAVAVSLSPHPGAGVAATIACGGHPPALRLRADGAVEEVGAGGTMLGVDADPELEPADVELAPGDALVLYTDGVTDARDAAGEDFGEQRLRHALAGAAGGDAEAIAGAIDAAVCAYQAGVQRDDRAILVLRAAP